MVKKFKQIFVKALNPLWIIDYFFRHLITTEGTEGRISNASNANFFELIFLMNKVT